MLGIKIKDSKTSGGGCSFLSFDLRDILSAIGDPASVSHWSCRDLCYTGKKGENFTEIREARRRLSGEEMMRFASEIHQTIDGRFEARNGGGARRPWLIILAVDSSWFEVWSSKREVLERVRTRFEKVTDLPAAAA